MRTYDLNDFVVLCSFICLEESSAGSFVSGIGDWSSTGSVEVVSHVVRVWEGRGGSSDLGTHVGDSSKTGARLGSNTRAKVLQNASSTSLIISPDQNE
jgi:hypothetical protein